MKTEGGQPPSICDGFPRSIWSKMKGTTVKIRMQTGCGEMILALEEKAAPQTVQAFLDYLGAGAYADTAFFRIVNETHTQAGAAAKINVLQGGPRFDTSGHDPALQLFDMPHEPTSVTGLKHCHGAIAMGRFAPGESYGGFYICNGDQPELDAGGARFPDGLGGAVFGLVVEGFETLSKIAEHAGESEFTDRPVPIHSIVVI